MLLRSASTPVLDSFIGHQADSEVTSCVRRSRSVQLSPAFVDSTFKRVNSVTDLNSHHKLSIGPSNPWPRARRSKSYGSSICLDNTFDIKLSLEDVVSNSEEEDADNDSVFGYGSFSQLTSTGSGSADGVASHKDKHLGFTGMFKASGMASLVQWKSESEVENMYSNGGYGGGGGVRYGCQGGSSGSDSSSTDEYYQSMLKANPDNPLLLRNYARFLHEVQHDLKKAEEYYGRTILGSPSDGDALSLYAKLIWDVHKDAPRAESYFDRAVEAAPDDCYVLGSYAHFLWNAGDEEEDMPMKPNNTSTECFGAVAAAS